MPAESKFLLFTGSNTPPDSKKPRPKLPPAPPWRTFSDKSRKDRGRRYRVPPAAIDAVNAAICLRRPLLVTGQPGIGKSTLAEAVAHELGLGEVLEWQITSRSTLTQGLYTYDALARFQDVALAKEEDRDPLPIGEFLKLGPLGTAIADSTPELPRVLLIDEIDKSDVDLPNDLLHVFEKGDFGIAELERLRRSMKEVQIPLLRSGGREVKVVEGLVPCRAFPIVFLTSNGEREFPAAFRRRCLPLDLKHPEDEAEAVRELKEIVERRLTDGVVDLGRVEALIADFVKFRDREKRELATDQLLNAVHVLNQGLPGFDERKLRELLLRALSES